MSACSNGCGYCGSGSDKHFIEDWDEMLLDEMARRILAAKGRKTWLFVLDFFDSMNLDIFEALPLQNFTPLTVEGCVQTFVKNYLNQNRILDLANKGVKDIWFGVESASPALRDEYQKPSFTNMELADSMRALNNYGIAVHWYLVHGPRDTQRTVLDTNELMRALEPSGVWYSKLLEHVPGQDAHAGQQ